MVTASWFTMPTPPRRFTGAISDTYMGTSEVLRPVGTRHDGGVDLTDTRKCTKRVVSSASRYIIYICSMRTLVLKGNAVAADIQIAEDLHRDDMQFSDTYV